MQLGMRAMCAVLMLAGLAPAFASSAPADSLKVKTASGEVQGKTINSGKVRAFLGLPYAAPPIGDLRWRAPEAPASWPW